MAIEAPLDERDPGLARSLKLKIRDRIDDSERHLSALRLAMTQFGPNFEQAQFESAFLSNNPALLNQVKAVERGSEQLFNYIAELASFGLELATLKDHSAALNSRRDFRQLKEIGVLSSTQESTLQVLRELRRNLVHEYPGVSAKDAHEAAILALREYRPFIQTYAAWMKRNFAARED